MSHAASPQATRSETPASGRGHARGARRRRAGRGVPLAAGASYGGHLLPALFLTYFDLGLGFMPMTLTAVHGVAAVTTRRTQRTAAHRGGAPGRRPAGDVPQAPPLRAIGDPRNRDSR